LLIKQADLDAAVATGECRTGGGILSNASDKLVKKILDGHSDVVNASNAVYSAKKSYDAAVTKVTELQKRRITLKRRAAAEERRTAQLLSSQANDKTNLLEPGENGSGVRRRTLRSTISAVNPYVALLTGLGFVFFLMCRARRREKPPDEADETDPDPEMLV